MKIPLMVKVYARLRKGWKRLNKDAQQLDLLRYLRGVFNPDNILNPGKLSDFDQE